MAKSASSKKLRGIYEHPKGSGLFWVCWFDHLGKRHREKAGTRSTAKLLYNKRKADSLLLKKLPELAHKAVTFRALAEDALEYSLRNKRSFQDDKERLRYLVEFFGDRPAESITPLEIDRWLGAMKRKPGTLNRYKAVMSLAYRIGIQNGKVASNPARLVRNRPELNERVRFLSREEETRLRQAIAEAYPELLPHFDFALNTGLRWGNMYSLEWQNVDFERRQVHLSRTKHGGSLNLPLNETAVAALMAVFRGKFEGKVFKRHDPRYWFAQAASVAGIEGLRWHDLRHTFASRLVMAGVAITTVRELMGHRSITSTMRYAHLSQEHKEEAVGRIVEQSATRSATELKQVM